ncbi:MAG: exodeoxyribonuclease VII large subunit [Peptococcaceae bacterium]|nr:exodeoxyribonuclease VII large subunit [Peptococcaceae bacterium]
MQTQREILSVSDINLYIKNLLQQDGRMSSVLVRGEISNFTRHSSGHLYFSLKDRTGSIKCVMFRSNAQRLQFQPAHGMEVLIAGYVSVYERDGVYQLYAEQMMQAGAGALHMAYEKLKAKLLAEGLFDKDRKRSLPFLPQKIGIVTSPTGAAIRDLLSIIRRRNPAVSVYVVPAIVQGKEGIASICQSLDILYQQDMDVIITGRGGGSLEELWCFNEEAVVRKIAASPVPIISAVGHETDVTLADFAADVRAATPSMAAELAVPVQAQLQEELMLRHRSLIQRYESCLRQKRLRLEHLAQHRILQKPELLLQDRQQLLDDRTERLQQAIEQILQKRQQQLAAGAEQLNALSPLNVLSRGYALCENNAGKLVRRADDVETGDTITVILEQGRLSASVTGREEDIWK